MYQVNLRPFVFLNSALYVHPATFIFISPIPPCLQPYADSHVSWWSGYFTSHPTLKGYIREGASYFAAARALQTIVGGVNDVGVNNSLYAFERAISVAQHHDAVSGAYELACCVNACS